MIVLGNRVLVSRLGDKPKKEGEFETVEVQTDFLYKGKIEKIGESVYNFRLSGMSSSSNPDPYGVLKEGDVVLFAKYSPHTQSVDVEGEDMKIIRVEDILAVL